MIKMINKIIIQDNYKGLDILVKNLDWSDNEYTQNKIKTGIGIMGELMIITSDWHTGYVRIPEDHAIWHVREDEHFLNDYFDVHGGITFTGAMPGQEGWWIGIDANHYGDNSIDQDSRFILNECKKIIDQIRGD